ncbi:ankyrin repeat-containing domain protein [Mycena filopes]|nr:ankyrin repeat-containing domain protein [Mycena filopes]
MTPPAKPAKSKINQLQDAATFGLEILDLFADLTKDVPYLGVVSRCVEKVLDIRKEMKDNKQRADELLDKILDVSRMLAEGFKEVDVVKRSAAEEKLQEDLKRYLIVLSDTADALTEWMEKGFLRRVTSDFHGIATNLERKIQTFRELFNASRLIGLSKGQDLLNMQHLVDNATQTRLNNWLHPPQISVSQRNALNQRHPAGTGSWLLSLPTFKEWIYTLGSFLWLHGISGCGKTILSSIIIDDLRHRAEQCIYFYFDTNNPDQNTVTHLLSSLVSQLSIQAHLPDEKLKTLWKSYNNGQQLPTTASLTSDALLPLLAECKKPVYIVLDALDECSDHLKLLKLITQIVDQKLDNVHLLVTSRPETAHGTELVQCAIEVALDSCIDKDIELHLNEWLSEQSGWIHNNRDFVKTKVLERSRGMFRLLTLHLDEITACTGRANKIQETLAKLPKSLHDKYTQIMGSFAAEMVANISRAMTWLIYSQRLLTPAELIDALAMDFEKEPLRFNRNNRFDPPEAVLGLCAGFIVASKKGFGTIVRIAHASVKEYFLSTTSPHCISEQAADYLIARTCIGYLLSLNRPPQCERYPSYEDSEYPLGVYAATSWASHVTLCDEIGLDEVSINRSPLRLENSDENPIGLIQSIFELLRPNTPAYSTLCCFDIEELKSPHPRIQKARFVAPLYIAAAFGIGQVVWGLLDRGANPNMTDPGRYGPLCPLDVACWEGYTKIVQLLLQYGANPNTRHKLWTPLQAASHLGHIDIVRLLLQSGAHATLSEACNGTHDNPELVVLLLEAGADVTIDTLYKACNIGHTKIARLLLEHGAQLDLEEALQRVCYEGNIGMVYLLLEHSAVDVNAQSVSFGTALHAASSEGHIEVVHLLLNSGAAVNTTILKDACEHGHIEVARLLLNSGAEVNTQSNTLSPLCTASAHGKVEVVRLLLEHGANVNAWGEQCSTALQAASLCGNIEVTRLLLDNGANVNAPPGKQYGTALQAASYCGNIKVARLLLENGADVNAPPGKQYGTALQAASRNSKVEVVRLLLEHGADVNTRGEQYYGTALQVASFYGDIEVARLLLEHGAEVNAPPGKQYGTALQAASRNSKVEVVRLLLEHGADVNARGEQYYGTALQVASFYGDIEVARLLLEHGAEVNTPLGEQPSTALQAASYRGNIEVARLLLDNSADVNARGEQYYGTALQAASFRGDIEVTRLLLDHGADVNAPPGEQHGTALQAASFCGNIEVTRLLLENGADVNTPSGEQYGTALQAASRNGKVQVVCLLLEHGADVNASGEQYGTALEAASYHGHLKVIRLLLEHGADVNAQGEQYSTALQAAFCGNIEVTRLLLDNGADVNTPSGAQYGTALQAASHNGEVQVIRLLLEHGADVNAPGERYGTALQAALRYGRVEVICLLLKHGANGR